MAKLQSTNDNGVFTFEYYLQAFVQFSTTVMLLMSYLPQNIILLSTESH